MYYTKEQLSIQIVLLSLFKQSVLFCSLVTNLAFRVPADAAFSADQDSLFVTITGVNLSEDMSTLSSKNDELLLLLYSFDDTLSLNEPLMTEYFVLDSANRKKIMAFPTPGTSTDVLLILAELDTERSPDQIEKLIRKNFRAIMNCLEKRDLVTLRQYIGDDDVIGIKTIRTNNVSRGITFSFSGRYKLDKYLYRIEIRKPQP